MLVDFSDGIKLGGEPKPIMVDLSDEKKTTLDVHIGRPHSLDDGLILNLASRRHLPVFHRRPRPFAEVAANGLGFAGVAEKKSG